MDKFENEKRCQTYEVTDFQHNFEITHPTTTLQQWGLHIHSTHYELLVFIRGNAECWIEGRRKKLEYVNVHMTEDISVQDIADALNVSRYYLSHA
jgi:mannose-6-phosphate isomerase-like protein (cupin superfamily)